MNRKMSWLALTVFAIVVAGCNSPQTGPSRTSTPAATSAATSTRTAVPVQTTAPTPSPEPPTVTPTPVPTLILRPRPTSTPAITYSPTIPPTLTPTVTPTIVATVTPTVLPTAPPTPYPQRTPPPQTYLRKGETTDVSGTRLTFSFQSSLESELVAIPYFETPNADPLIRSNVPTYYVFRAKTGYKFALIRYRFVNNYNEEQVTPGVVSGDIFTQPQGYIYKLWVPPQQSDFEAYSHGGTSNLELFLGYATPQQIVALGGTDGSGVKLLQGYGTSGQVIFEIPSDTTPVEVTLGILQVRLLLAEQPAQPTVAPSPSPQPAVTPLP